MDYQRYVGKKVQIKTVHNEILVGELLSVEKNPLFGGQSIKLLRTSPKSVVTTLSVDHIEKIERKYF